MTTAEITPMQTENPLRVWWTFADAIGDEALLQCYGWKRPPTARRSGEMVWEYEQAVEGPIKATVGWGSLIKDPTTPAYWHASGVFPTFQRMGYRQAIRQHLCGEAFARGAEAVSLVVLDTNPEHLTRCEREEKAGSPWKLSGAIWRPQPGQRIFTLLRVDWQAQTLSDELAREKVCCCFHLHMPDAEPACGRA